MKVYAIPLAEVPARASFVTAGGSRLARVRLSVGVLLVDHPKGKVLIDAGLPEQPGLVDRVAASVLTGRIRHRHRTVTAVLREQGIEPDEIRDVVLTHLHWDHTGAVPAFRRARVTVGPGELEVARGKLARATSFLGAGRVLAGGVVEAPLHDFDDGGAAFPKAHDLFGDGAIVLLPTPGHTPGSLSVLLRLEGAPLLHVGDAAYSLDNLRNGVSNGSLLGRPADLDRERALRSAASLLEYEAATGAWLLPAHDASRWAALPGLTDAIREL